MPPIAAAISDGISLGIAVCGTTADTHWGGCNIYASVDGGDTYGWLGMVAANGPARYGTLSGSLAAVADPDTSSILGVTLGNTNLQLSTTVTDADADACQTLILVGAGATAEVMSYGQGILTSPGNYNLSYLRRGLYGSQPELQAEGALFVRLDSSIFQIAFDPGMAGQEIFFKFSSFNTVGRNPQDLSDVEAYPYTIPAALSVSGGNAWTVQGANVGVSADGRTVYKSGGAAAWDSAAYAPQPFLDGAFISFTAAGSLATYQMIGFSTAPTSGPNYSALRLAIYLAAGTLSAYQTVGGVISSLGNFGTYALGNTFEMRYDGVTIRCFKNGALFYAQRAPGLAVTPMICLDSPTAVVAAISYGPVSAVNAPTGSLLNTYPWVIGSSGSQGNYIDSVAAGNPASAIVQAGKASAPQGPYGTSEAIWRSQGTVFGANGGWDDSGDLYGIDPTKTYRSLVWVLWNGTGAGTPFFWHGCDPNYTNNLNGTKNTTPYFSQAVPLGTFAPGKWYLAVGFIHGAGYSGQSSGQSGIYDPLSGGLVVAGNDFVNIAGAPYQRQRVYHTADTSAAGLLYFAKPRFEEVNGNEPTLQALMAPASAIQGFVATGTAAITGTTVSKQGGSANWDSCVYSVNGYQIEHIAAKPIVNHYAMLGFSASPSNSSSYTNGNYLWYNANGTWWIYESGVAIASYGPVAASDLVEILNTGTAIEYLLNKVLIRTVSLAAPFSLYAFMPLYDSGAGWNLLDFGPTDVTGVIDTSGLGDNAATNIYIGSLAISGGSVGVPPGYNNGSLVNGPTSPPEDCTVIVTTTIVTGQLSGTLGLSVAANYNDDANTPGSFQVGPVIPLTLNALPYTLQWEFTHSGANAALPWEAGYTIYNSSGGSLSYLEGVGNWVTQVEFIRK